MTFPDGKASSIVPGCSRHLDRGGGACDDPNMGCLHDARGHDRSGRGRCQSAAWALCLLLAAGGCGRGDIAAHEAAEQTSPAVASAYVRLVEGDRDGAIVKLRDALDTHPRLARPHLDLALLLHDQRADYVRAIYHYQRYLELRPETEKRAMVVERIKHAARAYAVQAGTLESDELPDEAMTRLERENRRLRDALAAQSNAVTQVRGELERVTADRDAAAAETVAAQAARDEAREALRQARLAMARDREPSPVPGVGVVGHGADEALEGGLEDIHYTVVEGDNLSRLARRFYGDATLWLRIQEANTEVLNGSVILRAGQELRIPGADRGGEP